MFFKTHVRWVEVFTNSFYLENFAEGKVRELLVDGKTLLGVNQKSELKVFDELCPHQKASLKGAFDIDECYLIKVAYSKIVEKVNEKKI